MPLLELNERSAPACTEVGLDVKGKEMQVFEDHHEMLILRQHTQVIGYILPPDRTPFSPSYTYTGNKLEHIEEHRMIR